MFDGGKGKENEKRMKRGLLGWGRGGKEGEGGKSLDRIYFLYSAYFYRFCFVPTKAFTLAVPRWVGLGIAGWLIFIYSAPFRDLAGHIREGRLLLLFFFSFRLISKRRIKLCTRLKSE